MESEINNCECNEVRCGKCGKQVMAHNTKYVMIHEKKGFFSRRRKEWVAICKPCKEELYRKQ